ATVPRLAGLHNGRTTNPVDEGTAAAPSVECVRAPDLGLEPYASWTRTAKSARTGSAPDQHEDPIEAERGRRRRSEGSRGDPGGNCEVPHRSREQQGDGDRTLRAPADRESEEYRAREKDPEGAQHSEIARGDVDLCRDQPDEPCDSQRGDPAGRPLAPVPDWGDRSDAQADRERQGNHQEKILDDRPRT